MLVVISVPSCTVLAHERATWESQLLHPSLTHHCHVMHIWWAYGGTRACLYKPKCVANAVLATRLCIGLAHAALTSARITGSWVHTAVGCVQIEKFFQFAPLLWEGP
jgi:hypothetical protein